MAETEEGEARWRLEVEDLPIQGRLGRGLSGYVYETTWGGEKRARKDFPLGSAERNRLFELEVKKVCKLDEHPNVVKCFGYTIGTNSCSVVQEYVADNLQSSVQRRIDEEVIRRRGTSRPGPPRVLNLGEIKRLLSSRGKEKEKVKRKVGAFEAVPEAVDIISQIAAGMRHLHENGVVHGDLKPRNVLVLNPAESGGWKVKLADYGLTETKKMIRMVSERTRRAEILTWKAPECSGRKKSDHGSPDGDFLTEFDVDSDEEIEHVDEFLNSKLAMADVYSFGLTCSYILGGKPLSSDMSLTQLRQQRMQGFKPLLPKFASLDTSLKYVINLSLDTEPSQRLNFSDICNLLNGMKAYESWYWSAPEYKRLTESVVRKLSRGLKRGFWQSGFLKDSFMKKGTSDYDFSPDGMHSTTVYIPDPSTCILQGPSWSSQEISDAEKQRDVHQLKQL